MEFISTFGSLAFLKVKCQSDTAQQNSSMCNDEKCEAEWEHVHN